MDVSANYILVLLYITATAESYKQSVNNDCFQLDPIYDKATNSSQYSKTVV